MTGIICATITGVFALIVTVIEARTSRDKKISERREVARMREAQLSMEIQAATLALSDATAVSLQQGHTNGEVKDARKKAKIAQGKYDAFLMEQTASALARI